MSEPTLTFSTSPSQNNYITQEQCLAQHGHCYVTSPIVLTSYPPIYTRSCKHCGHTQRGRPQSDIDWQDYNHA